MKLVFLSYLHGFGGAEKQNVMLANNMAERGHDVTLISICSDNKCYSLNKRVNYIFIPDRKANILRIATRYQDIKSKLHYIKPDITINFWYQTAYLSALMGKNTTGKIIYSERSDPGDKQYKGILGIVRKLTLPRIDGFVFQSKGAKSYFDKAVQDRSIIIPNAVVVNNKSYIPFKVRRKAIVTVGRLHPQKNHKLLIDAFALIANEFSDYTLEIYGDGSLKDTLQRQINQLGLSNKVFLKGTSSKIQSLIYDASLFVLSSDYEGLPNTLLEAMALGIPCISTDCRPGGAREIITEGENGMIVPLGNAVLLAHAMSTLLQQREIGEMYSKRSVISMRRFNVDKIYSEWEQYFISIKGK